MALHVHGVGDNTLCLPVFPQYCIQIVRSRTSWFTSVWLEMSFASLMVRDLSRERDE